MDAPLSPALSPLVPRGERVKQALYMCIIYTIPVFSPAQRLPKEELCLTPARTGSFMKYFAWRRHSVPILLGVEP